METVCILYPGEMGAAVGRVARDHGARVLWASERRGDVTRKRAAAAGLEDAGSLRAALAASEIVLSVCPPHAALQVAQSIAAQAFSGIYVDANAVSPDTTRRVGAAVEAVGATFVDGGIVGPPPSAAEGSRLYLCGREAERVARLFAGTPLTTVVLDAPVGAASALKACYAAWTKGTAALLITTRALAEREGVAQALADEWRLSQPDLFKRLDRAVANTRKGWRWVGEMEEIAATFAAANLPDGFHSAAAEVFRRLERFKDNPSSRLQDVLAELFRVEPPQRARHL